MEYHGSMIYNLSNNITEIENLKYPKLVCKRCRDCKKFRRIWLRQIKKQMNTGKIDQIIDHLEVQIDQQLKPSHLISKEPQNKSQITQKKLQRQKNNDKKFMIKIIQQLQSLYAQYNISSYQESLIQKLNYNNQIMNLNWIKQQQSKTYEGQQKQGYTLTYISHLQCLLLFGGSHSNRNNQIYLYHLVKKQWTVQKTTSPKPAPRKYHTAFYQKSIRGLIIYGGEAEKGRSLDTFDILFIDDWKWRKLLFKVIIPSPREFHTFTSMSNGNFLIFGGVMLPYGTYLQDLWVLKGIDKLKDTKTLQMAGCSCTQIVGKGNPPTGRFAHRAYYHGQTFFVLGGETESQQQNFTVYSLSMRTMQWQKNNFNINLPQIIGFSQIKNPSNPNQILIFGGITTHNKIKKPNHYIYSMSLQPNPKLKKEQKLPHHIDHTFFNNSCQLPFNQVCGICYGFNGNSLELYRMEIQQKEVQQLGIEQYLKYIKNEQLLSQELIGKVSNLQNLYQEIQTYISKLFKQYQQSGQYDEQIERQKKAQIQTCLQLKSQYLQIQQVYEQNGDDLKKARKELASINQYFQGYIQTQRDQDQQQ